MQHSKPEVASALRIFTVQQNYPILVHCIHGKDRTGLVVGLVLLLCGALPGDVVADYAISGKCQKCPCHVLAHAFTHALDSRA